jgi:hypothetical protein
MLRLLPFTTFGEFAALQLEANVCCPRCRALRRIDPRPTVSAIEFSRARGFDAGVVTLLVSLRSGQGHPCTEGIERVRLEGRLRFRPSSCKALKSRTSCNPPLGTIHFQLLKAKRGFSSSVEVGYFSLG